MNGRLSRRRCCLAASSLGLDSMLIMLTIIVPPCAPATTVPPPSRSRSDRLLGRGECDAHRSVSVHVGVPDFRREAALGGRDCCCARRRRRRRGARATSSCSAVAGAKPLRHMHAHRRQRHIYTANETTRSRLYFAAPRARATREGSNTKRRPPHRAVVVRPAPPCSIPHGRRPAPPLLESERRPLSVTAS